MTQIELDMMQTICANLPLLNDIVKQLKIRNEIDLLQLKKDNGYAIRCGDINDIDKSLHDA